MKKLAVIVLAIVTSMCLISCSSASEKKAEESETVSQKTESAPEIQDLQIESGFTQTNYGPNIGILITNPNDNITFEGCSLAVTAKDADGKVVATDPDYKMGKILPKESFGFGLTHLSVKDGTIVASVEVKIKSSKKTESNESVSITVDNMSDAQSSIIGEYTNNDDKTYGSVMIGILLRNADGVIVGGGYDEQDTVAPGTLPFEAYHFGVSYQTYETSTHVYRY